jgi:hypothetical protein
MATSGNRTRSNGNTRKAPGKIPIAVGVRNDSKVGKDDAFDPFYQRVVRASGNQSNPYAQIGNFVPAQQMIHPIELYAASFTPKGSFLTRVAPRSAFRSDWKFVPYKGSREPLKENLVTKLRAITKTYQLKKIVTAAVQVAEIFGRSLVYRRQVSQVGKAKKWRLFVTYIPDEYITYNQTENYIEMYRPMVGWGMGTKSIDIKPTDAVLFIGEMDPMGNGFQGIPALVAPYRTIVRGENIEEAWSDIVTKRGLGLVDLLVEGAETEKDLEPWLKKYGDPSSYNVLVHNERLKVETKDGMKQNFDLNATMDGYTKEIASSSGYPKLRIEGLQTGTVTGSETDQDTTAEQYSTLHERYEDPIMDLYRMLDTSLENEEFELEWEFEIKMDKARKSNIFATDSGSVMTVQDIIKVNQGLEILGFPAIKDKTGEMFISEFIAQTGYPEGQAKVTAPLGEGFPLPGGENPREKETAAKLEIAQTQKPAEKSGGSNFKKDSLDDSQITEWVNFTIAADIEGNIPEGIDKIKLVSEGLRKIGNRNLDKDKIAAILVKAGTDLDSQLSYKEVNNILTSVFGSGKSPNWLKDKRYK